MNVYAHLLRGVHEEAVANLEAKLQRRRAQAREHGRRNGHQTGTKSAGRLRLQHCQSIKGYKTPAKCSGGATWESNPPRTRASPRRRF